MKIQSDEPLSNSAFNFNSRHYIEAVAVVELNFHSADYTSGSVKAGCVVVQVESGVDT